MAFNYYLRIERFAQNRYSGDPETDVSPDYIDSEKNLHVYLTGAIPEDRTCVLHARRLTPVLDHRQSDSAGDPGPSIQTYKASLPHYTLSVRTPYLLKALDDAQDPWAITSAEIKTI